MSVIKWDYVTITSELADLFVDFLDGEKVVGERAEVEGRLSEVLSALEKCPEVQIMLVKELLRGVLNAFQNFTNEQIHSVLDALQYNIFTAQTYLSEFLGESERNRLTE